MLSFDDLQREIQGIANENHDVISKYETNEK
jgi:hypothetical protein